ncbi:mitochondrial 54S ribosomal protein YmL49 [Pichia kluyveri]|uniref:Large ribosomal subunit protein bL21m n=1 Tax=Pichia kluyveri TaxID=36015 RepID=A0AAV5R6J2_PICKL|nr:mitochondrial 54S ribosomal protein YmL49 [Pichia kluyveri]
MFRRLYTTAVKDTKLLQPLKFEDSLYATLKIHNRSYLVTKGDIVNLPFCLHTANVGDSLKFTKIDTIGSRNYTYNINDGIDNDLVSVSATVIEKTKIPMTIKEVTKRRNRHTKHIHSKHDITVLRVDDVKIL